MAAEEGADYTLHLYRDGRLVTAHAWWADPAEMPTQEEAQDRATALAAAYGMTDHRPLTAVLRGTGDPRQHLDEAFATLGLPSLPAGFGYVPEPVSGERGAQLVERRSFFRAGGAHGRRPRRGSRTRSTRHGHVRSAHVLMA
ncbi:hypothetical protein ABIE67_000675 [Streptomyces sp. V4I8]|uniref:hypothetical protein n=1 Tax=Streptomyces sp. V4I8 TaxID=3156469 RepID=UPI003517A913